MNDLVALTVPLNSDQITSFSLGSSLGSIISPVIMSVLRIFAMNGSLLSL